MTDDDARELGSSARIEIAPRVFAAAPALRIQYARSGGPGGQNVNKVNTKAELWLSVSAITGLSERALARLRDLAGSRLTQQDEIHIRSDAERSQEANRNAVFERLRELIVKARVEPKPRKRTKPSKAAKQRRLDAKKRRSQVKSTRRRADDSW